MASQKTKGNRLYKLAWHLNDTRRFWLCAALGCITAAVLNFLLHWSLAAISGWIVGVGLYLILLFVVIFTADGLATERRLASHDPNRLKLLATVVTFSLPGNIFLGILLNLTSAHSAHHPYPKLLIGFAFMAVLLSSLFLHTEFGKQYGQYYYESNDQGEFHRDFDFPDTSQPAYLDFMYVTFTIALTYALSDVNARTERIRMMILFHSLISFFFYSLIIGAMLSALVPS